MSKNNRHPEIQKRIRSGIGFAGLRTINCQGYLMPLFEFTGNYGFLAVTTAKEQYDRQEKG